MLCEEAAGFVRGMISEYIFTINPNFEKHFGSSFCGNGRKLMVAVTNALLLVQVKFLLVTCCHSFHRMQAVLISASLRLIEQNCALSPLASANFRFIQLF